MTYDLPTAELQAGSSPAIAAPEDRNVAAEQAVKLGNATTQAGAAATQIGSQIQNDIDTAVAKDADNILANYARESLYNPETGYLQTSKRNALIARDGVVKGLQEKVEDISKSLSNDMQRYMFKNAATARMQSVMLSVDRHAANQAKAYREDTTRARVLNFGEDMVANSFGWKTPNSLYAQRKGHLLTEIGQLADLAGWSPEERKKTERETLTQIASNVIDNMISLGYSKDAKEYFDEANKKGEILSDKINELTDKLKLATTATEADTLAQAAVDKFFSPDRNAAIPIAEASNWIREQAGDNEDVQKAALTNFKERVGERNAEQTEFKAQNVSKVWGLIDSGKNYRRDPAWLALTDLERHAISKQLEEESSVRANRAAANSQKELAELQRKERLAFLQNGDAYLRATNPKVLKGMSRAQVEALRSTLGLEATEQLLNKWDSIQNPTKYAEAKMDADDFRNLALNMGLDPDGKVKGMRNKVGALRFHIEQAIDVEQMQRGKSMTRQEKTEFIKKEMSKTVLTEGWFSNPRVSALALTPQQRKNIIVPEEEARKIQAAMSSVYKKTGDPAFAPTRQNLVREYLKGISPGAAANFEGVE